MSKKYTIHQNYDTPPKLFGIFNYTTILISLAITLPIVFIISKLNFSIDIKVYCIFIVVFPVIMLNIVFSRVTHLHRYIYYAIRYLFSEKIYVYSKNNKIAPF